MAKEIKNKSLEEAGKSWYEKGFELKGSFITPMVLNNGYWTKPYLNKKLISSCDSCDKTFDTSQQEQSDLCLSPSTKV